MICQEGSPSLGRRFAGPRQIPGHRGLLCSAAQKFRLASKLTDTMGNRQTTFNLYICIVA
jgi:hypothetical protein